MILYASAAFEQEIANASEAVSGRQRRKKLFGVGAGGQIKLILTDNIGLPAISVCVQAGKNVMTIAREAKKMDVVETLMYLGAKE